MDMSELDKKRRDELYPMDRDKECIDEETIENKFCREGYNAGWQARDDMIDAKFEEGYQYCRKQYAEAYRLLIGLAKD